MSPTEADRFIVSIPAWQIAEIRCPGCAERPWFPPTLDAVRDANEQARAAGFRQGGRPCSLPLIHLHHDLIVELTRTGNPAIVIPPDDVPSVFGRPTCRTLQKPPEAVVRVATLEARVHQLDRELVQTTNKLSLSSYQQGALRQTHELLMDVARAASAYRPYLRTEGLDDKRQAWELDAALALQGALRQIQDQDPRLATELHLEDWSPTEQVDNPEQGDAS